jgi:hypothetical protein
MQEMNFIMLQYLFYKTRSEVFNKINSPESCGIQDPSLLSYPQTIVISLKFGR